MAQQKLMEILKRRWILTKEVVGADRAHQMFSGAKTSLMKLTAYSTILRTRFLKSYQLAEKEIWGKVALLHDEPLLLESATVSQDNSK